jgi:hypothetical protein
MNEVMTPIAPPKIDATIGSTSLQPPHPAISSLGAHTPNQDAQPHPRSRGHDPQVT